MSEPGGTTISILRGTVSSTSTRTAQTGDTADDTRYRARVRRVDRVG